MKAPYLHLQRTGGVEVQVDKVGRLDGGLDMSVLEDIGVGTCKVTDTYRCLCAGEKVLA